MSKQGKGGKLISIIITVLAVSSLAGLIITGEKIGWGPFKGLYWGGEVQRIGKAYPAEDNRDGIVFYGASNFRLWTEMENDLSDYAVVNAGFGGSTDRLMVQYADRLLYPYHPKLVFLQTGSNDYVEMDGTDEEKISACMEYKKEMIAAFHRELPDARFVIMSGLLKMAVDRLYAVQRDMGFDAVKKDTVFLMTSGAPAEMNPQAIEWYQTFEKSMGWKSLGMVLGTGRTDEAEALGQSIQ